MTRKEWDGIYRHYKGSRTIAATEQHGEHRVRSRVKGCAGIVYVYVTDMPRKDPPPPSADLPTERPRIPAPQSDTAYEIERLQRNTAARIERGAEAAPYETLRSAADAGVLVVSAPQLFPTPAHLASRLVEEADIRPGHRVLEPSAGTGALLDAIKAARGHLDLTYAVERHHTSCEQLRRRYDLPVRCIDFLEYREFPDGFDRIVANPPFHRGQDVKHIQHMLTMLKPGGRLVSLCADGPKQREQLESVACASGGFYESLPAGSFSEQGTDVSIALVVINRITTS